MYVLRVFLCVFCVCFCVCVCVCVCVFLQNTTIAMVFDDAIYLFLFCFSFSLYFNVIASKSHTKNNSENGREK